MNLQMQECSSFASQMKRFLMKRKIMFLICACIFTVVALAVIQGYFIYNTYQLIEKEVTASIKKQLTDLEDTDEWYDINGVWMRKTKSWVDDYTDGKASKEDLEKYLKTNRDSLVVAMKKYTKKLEKPDDYNIDYSVYINSIVIKEQNQTDSIFKGKMLVLANDTLKKNRVESSEGRWENNYLHNGKEYTLTVRSNRYYGFDEWQQTILGKMSGLLAFSIILMAFVVYLYYLSLKNLISQKRIADIKTDFVNNITHEFQTPLATMDIAIKTLQRKDKQMNEAHYQSTLAMIDRQNERLQKLFRQVTEASIAPIVNKETVMVSCASIKEMIDDFKLSKPDISIECSIPKEPMTVSMDRFHLNTILVNLLDNAVKYGADVILIDLKISKGKFILSVADNGKGIPFKEQSSIFDKFYKVEKGNIHNTKGLGLGLFYCKQLIETYNGNIKVESEEGKGATFIISIPV